MLWGLEVRDLWLPDYIYCQRSAQYFYPLTTSGKRIKIILIINSLVLHVFFAPFDSAQGADNIFSSTLSGVKGHGKLLKSIHLSSQIPLRSLYGATFNAFALTNYAQLLAFVFGTGYILWLAYSLYSLRAQRSRFKLELFAFLQWHWSHFRSYPLVYLKVLLHKPTFIKHSKSLPAWHREIIGRQIMNKVAKGLFLIFAKNLLKVGGCLRKITPHV